MRGLADAPEIHGILRDTVNNWAVRILLECILAFLPSANKVAER